MTIFFYFSINLMMVMGLAPVVGIPLPLVSFGGSAVMTVMICLGVLMSLERQQRTTLDAELSDFRDKRVARSANALLEARPRPPLARPAHLPHGMDA